MTVNFNKCMQHRKIKVAMGLKMKNSQLGLTMSICNS